MTDHLPKAVSNLRILWAFRDLAVDIRDCITESCGNPLYIVDDTETGCSRLEYEPGKILQGAFIAYNPRNRNLYLLAIDNKMFTNVTGGIADCAVFSLADFTFIEFKTNAEGKSKESVKYTYCKALDQLENTLEIFSRHFSAIGIDFRNHIEVTAQVVISPKFPRSSATEQQLMVEFFDRNLIELSFDNNKTFQ